MYASNLANLRTKVACGLGGSILAADLRDIDFRQIELADLRVIGSILISCPRLAMIRLNTENLSGDYDDAISKKLTALVLILSECVGIRHVDGISSLKSSFPEQYIYLNAIGKIRAANNLLLGDESQESRVHPNAIGRIREADRLRGADDESKELKDFDELKALSVRSTQALLCLIATDCGAKIEEMSINLAHKATDPTNGIALDIEMISLMSSFTEQHQNLGKLSTEGFKRLLASCAHYFAQNETPVFAEEEIPKTTLSTLHFTTMGCHVPGATVKAAPKTGFEILESAFSHLSGLRKINILSHHDTATFFGKELKLLKLPMSRCQSLQEIEFDTDRLYFRTRTEVEILGEILASAESLQVLSANLVRLIFRHADNEEEQQARSDIFGHYLSLCRSLHTIKIDVDWNDTFKHVFLMLSKCPNLRTIELRFKSDKLIPWQALVEDVRRCKNPLRKPYNIKVVGIELTNEQSRTFDKLFNESQQLPSALESEVAALLPHFPSTVLHEISQFVGERDARIEQRHCMIMATSNVLPYISGTRDMALNIKKAETALVNDLVKEHALARDAVLRGHNAAVATVLQTREVQEWGRQIEEMKKCWSQPLAIHVAALAAFRTITKARPATPLTIDYQRQQLQSPSLSAAAARDGGEDATPPIARSAAAAHDGGGEAATPPPAAKQKKKKRKHKKKRKNT